MVACDAETRELIDAMNTFHLKPADVKKNWIHVDAKDQTLGRLATEIARVLRGKHKPTFTPHVDCGDFVVVTNADKVRLTGRKWRDKFYYRHTGYPGGMKSDSAEALVKKHPDQLVMNAVKGMLPRTKLGRNILKNLKVYAGDAHPHEAQKPQPLTPRLNQG